MTFIRTKDGRVIKIDETKELIPDLELAKSQGKVVMYQGVEVIAKAYFVEELCDGFISVIDGRITCFFTKEEGNRWLFKRLASECKEAIHYGIIKVNGENRQVAMLNRRGEFEYYE